MSNHEQTGSHERADGHEQPRCEDDVDVVVVGAGLAGLTAAAHAARAGASVVVLDAHGPGGRAHADVVGPGAVLNRGPRALYRAGAARRELAALGIEPRGGVPSSRGTQGWDGRRTGVLPVGLPSLVRSPFVGLGGTAQLGRLLSTLPRSPLGGLEAVSTEAWLGRLRPDAAEVVRTILRVATYTQDLSTLSADAAVRQLQLVLEAGVLYLDGGWDQLVDALREVVDGAGGAVRPSSPVREVRGGDVRWRVELADRVLHAGAVVVAAGGPEVAEALTGVAPRGPVGEPVDAACLELVLDRPPRHRLVFGVGLPLYSSLHAPVADLAPEGLSVVHLLRYGARDHRSDRDELWRLAAVAGVHRHDVVADRFLARMVVAHGRPTPGGGLGGRPGVDALGRPGLLVAGDWVGPEGLLADAAVASGAEAGRRAAERASALSGRREAGTAASAGARLWA